MQRIIARLDIKNDYVIKGIHLEGLRKIGNPNELAKDTIKQMDVINKRSGNVGGDLKNKSFDPNNIPAKTLKELIVKSPGKGFIYDFSPIFFDKISTDFTCTKDNNHIW